MKNKVLIKLKVPEIDREYDIWLPINKKIGNIANLLNQCIRENSSDELNYSQSSLIYNAITGERYNPDSLLLDTNIRNGSVLVFIS